MNSVRALLKDRKRSQRGSVLSGVLIITAFIAIIAGALMTELSTNFLLSQNLVSRVANQATINSAMEMTMNQLGTTPISGGCPALNPVNLNGRLAVPSYTSCGPAYAEKRYPPIVQSSSFTVDGSHVRTRADQDLYLVGNSSGNVYQFAFGSQRPISFPQLPGSVIGPPMAMPDPGISTDILNLVPLSVQSNRPAGCQSGACVALLRQDAGYPPDSLCYLPANDSVTATPAAGVNNPTVAFFADHSGSVFAYQATSTCSNAVAADSSQTLPVVAGPVVLGNPNFGKNSVDEIYVVASDSFSSALLHYEYVSNKKGKTLTLFPIQPIPVGRAVGMAIDQQQRFPVHAAITFAGGTVALVTIQSDFTMSTPVSKPLGTAIADAPAWCCGTSPSLIGVAEIHTFYLLDMRLNKVSSYSFSTNIIGSPVADSVGDWFFGADDGNVYEVPGTGTTPVVLSFGSDQLGRIRSSTQVGACGPEICIYFGSTNGNAYMIRFDARDAVVTACISSAPPSCLGTNPRLRANLEVGASVNSRSVHVQGWSYYSG